MSLQVTIPNEWEKLAPINVGYTAGIETTKVAPQWIDKASLMDRIIVVSNHSKEVYEKTVYEGQNPQTQMHVTLKCTTPIDVVNYPVRNLEKEIVDLDLEYNFNYLAISQWGPRKNFDNLINWFIEENFDQEVGLVLKTSIRNNSLTDRDHTEKKLQSIIKKHGDIKCRVYLVHGDLTDEQMAGIYQHPKIKCLISTTHGEGYGLPLFEAASNGLPVVCVGWSGQKDFLYVPAKRSKSKTRPMFLTVEYDLKNVQAQAVWEGVVQPDSQWAYPTEGSFKKRLREVRKSYKKFKKTANSLQNHILENFTEEQIYSDFVSSVQHAFESSEAEFDSVFS